MTIRDAMRLYPDVRKWISGEPGPSPNLDAVAREPSNLARHGGNLGYSTAHAADAVLVALADAYVELMTPPTPPAPPAPPAPDIEHPEGL